MKIYIEINILEVTNNSSLSVNSQRQLFVAMTQWEIIHILQLNTCGFVQLNYKLIKTNKMIKKNEHIDAEQHNNSTTVHVF